MKNPKYEFYVLNYDFNQKKVVNFNIFNNWPLADEATELVEQFTDKKLTYDEFRTRLLKAIQWQEWSRREYEISVGDAFETDCTKLEKWDCYEQAKPNIEWIADMCLKRYREWKKEQKKESEV